MVADALRGLAALVLHVAARASWRIVDRAIETHDGDTASAAADLWIHCARGARAYGWHEEEIEA